MELNEAKEILNNAGYLIEEASKLIDDSDQIRALYNRNIEPFNIAEDKNGKDSNNQLCRR